MQTLRDFLQRWQQRGIYTRLFVPIFILIVVVSGLRYYLLIDAEVKDARLRSATELRHSSHYLIPALSSLSLQDDRQGIQQLLAQEVRASPAISRIGWRYRQEQFLEQDKKNDHDDTHNGVPAWFNALLNLQPETFAHQVRLSNGEIAMLRLDTTVGYEKRHIWQKVITQAKISLAIIVTIYFLLGLILRSNAKTLGKLASATDKFKKGQHAVRMSVSGTAEARALAMTFNNMADEVQTLLLTLQRSQRANSEQLHFTWQLLHALPIPIFFQDQHGICQRVNRAWEQMFDVRAEQVVGQTMPPLVTEITEQVTDDIPTRLDETADGKLVMEMTILVAGQMRDVIYYQASFTNVDGEAVGSIGALIDISERNDAQAALATENERVETTLASIGDAVISTDVDGQVLMLNKAAQQLSGWSREEARNHGLLEIFSLSDATHRARLAEFVNSICDSDEIFQANNQLLMASGGRQIEIDYTAAPIRQQNGTVTGCVLVFRDVSEKRRLMQQLSWQAGHDILTGLENRTALAVRFNTAIHHASAQQLWLAVCLLDLDHFQIINEKYGHEFADHLLQMVARRLEASVGTGNSVARLGGDEFVLLLQDQHSVATVEHRLALLLAEMAEPYEIDARTLSLSASIGVAIYPRDDINADTLLRCADQAMYQAKLNGRNQFHLFDAEQDQQLRTHHNQRARIRQALLDGEMRLYFQPKVNMQLGQVVGMEALIRWQHPEEGIVGPLNFLPLVEHTDLIIDIGDWVLHQAMQQLRNWGTENKRWIVSVNIAARHFQCKDFLDRLGNILNAYPDVAPDRLEIEILESAALQDIQHVREVMLACQQLGVSFALDDFGTGYSSLSYLKRLPANTLKIDQSFVRDMLDDKDDLAVISAVIGLARAFNRAVIAEGVESAEHGVALMRLGCYLAQGFGVARPMPAAQVADWARDYVAPLIWNQGKDLQWEGA
ncbi:bifunctional diguanylate cyclase/phosphodiesterase [Undibacterium sp. TJN19]|uniref:bifunctional diguanylate cyclase/phosphodiesterase n=1 Tax=Undibacterium sp. TJN19 TaxID=3413055 RepID=UPI003BF3913E